MVPFVLAGLPLAQLATIFGVVGAVVVGLYIPVSYTHLDVYKRQAIAERREELQQELLKEKKKQQERDGGASEEDKSLLQKKERELERLQREDEEQKAAGRQLDRLDRELRCV